MPARAPNPVVGHAGPAVSAGRRCGRKRFQLPGDTERQLPVSDRHGPWEFELLAYGRYIEFSIDGYVRLSLVDDTFRDGRLGFYAETAKIRIDGIELDHLYPPHDEASALTP